MHHLPVFFHPDLGQPKVAMVADRRLRLVIVAGSLTDRYRLDGRLQLDLLERCFAYHCRAGGIGDGLNVARGYK